LGRVYRAIVIQPFPARTAALSKSMLFKILRPTTFFVFLLAALVSACDSSSSSPEAEISFEDLTIGDGDEVFAGNTVIVGYVGRLTDGTIFDSSDIQEENLIFTLGVNNVIEGLDEGIPGMKVGGVRRIEIPASKAFGKTGMCTTDGDCPVPPNADVVFEITLVDILDYVLTEDIVVGPGPEAKLGTQIEIGYVGVLQNDRDRIFASSDASGNLIFVLGTGFVIQGLDQGIRGMHEGGVRRLIIPPELGYGRFGSLTGAVPPYATLIYKIELVKILSSPAKDGDQ
jgi:peptidylprolyl isomerase